MSMKNSNDIIGNRTRDLPACGAVPQLTAPPHAPPFEIDVNSFGKSNDPYTRWLFLY